MAEFKQAVKAHVRLASFQDVPRVLALIQQLAEFERLADECIASVDSLQATLFNNEKQQAPLFQGPSVLILEVSQDSPSPMKETDAYFQEEVHDVILRHPIKDPQAQNFLSSCGEDRTVAGFVLFFPNYSTFLAKPGFYIEDIYVRECFRGHGFGSILLKTVARLAVKLDYGRVEWSVLDWNEKAIKFYEGIGAKVLPEWRICRLTGGALNGVALESKIMDGSIL